MPIFTLLNWVSWTDRHTDGLTDIHTDCLTNGKTDGWADGQINIQTDKAFYCFKFLTRNAKIWWGSTDLHTNQWIELREPLLKMQWCQQKRSKNSKYACWPVEGSLWKVHFSDKSKLGEISEYYDPCPHTLKTPPTHITAPSHSHFSPACLQVTSYMHSTLNPLCKSASLVLKRGFCITAPAQMLNKSSPCFHWRLFVGI